MTTLKALFSKELDDLKTLRDELRVKAHLARADLNDELDKLETKWPAVEQAAKNFEAATLEVSAQVEKAAREGLGELRKAYDELVARPKPPEATASKPPEATATTAGQPAETKPADPGPMRQTPRQL
jgi:hypothetical protein